MDNNSNIFYLLIHLVIGVILYFLPILVFPYFGLILIYGTYKIVQAKQEDVFFNTLSIIFYIVGLEVLFRMKSDGSLYDLGKYSVVYFSFIGILKTGINLNSWTYFICFLLLVPGIYITITTFYFEVEIRKKIMFNLLGNFALITTSIFCFSKEIQLEKLRSVFFYSLGPLLAILVNVILFTPDDLRTSINSTGSNFDTSGGFGPNQMSVILGLGAFIAYFVWIFEISKSRLYKFLILAFFLLFVYRSLLTFSRGGTLTFILMFLSFNAILFYKFKSKAKFKIGIVLVFIGIIGLGIWSYSLFQTNGLIELRYKNQDAAGRVKESILTGRENIMSQEMQLFQQNPVFGVGPGMGAEYRSRLDENQEGVQAHSEITRLFAEHGIFGVIFLFLLVSSPLLRWYGNKKYLHILLIPLLVFWGLTINHAATRIVAPSVMYAITLLNIKLFDEEEDSLHRKSI